MQLEREIGTSGIKASAVGLGTWAMGGWMWGGGDDEASVTAIRASLDAGMTLIDTAPAYGLGRAEEAGRPRHRRAGATRSCWSPNAGWSGTMTERPALRRAGRQDDPSLSRRAIGAGRAGGEPEAAAHRPCRRADHALAGPDHADRRDDGRAAGAEEGGQDRAIGISNASADDLDAYIAAGQVDCVQEAYNMLDRGLEKTLLPVCRREGISVHQLFQPGARAADRQDRSGAGVQRRRSQAQQSALLGREPQAGGRASPASSSRSRDAMAARSARW